MSQWETNLTQEQIQRFTWNEEDIAALQTQTATLEQRVAALEAGGVYDASQAWEAPQEGDEGAEGEGAASSRRKGKRSTEGES